MTSVANCTLADSTAASLPLQMVGLLSTLIFLVNCSYELLVLHQLYIAQFFLIALLQGTLAAWSLTEIRLIDRARNPIPLRRLTWLLVLQLAFGILRHASDFQASHESMQGIPVSNNDFRMMPLFIIAHLLLFLSICKLLIDAFSFVARLRANELEHQMTVIRQQEQALDQARAAAETANRAKSEFLSNVSHELRTPMNAIIGLSQVMLETPMPATQATNLKTIWNSARALHRLLNDILDLAKVEAGKLDIVPVTFSPRQLLAEIEDLFRISFQEKGIEFILEIADSVPAQIRADDLRIRQILINLVGNALKFTKTGQVSVSVQPAGDANPISGLCFVISDTGIGLSAKQIAHLFQPFVQAEGLTSRRYGGTGLGLAISRHLVSLMRGTLEVSSEVGRGSTFSFTIRVEATAGTITDPPPPPAVSTLQPPAPLPPPPTLDELDIHALRGLLAHLEEQIDLNMLAANETGEKIAQQLVAPSLAVEFQPVLDNIRLFRYRQAGTALATFRAKLTR